MTRLLLISLTLAALLLGCEQKKGRVSPTDVEWVEVGESRTTFYVDPYNIYRKGERAKMWHLRDHKTTQTSDPTGEPYLSTRIQQEYDCGEVRTRILEVTNFSGHMGSGKITYTDSSESEWVSIEPGNTLQRSWKLACGKK